MQMAKMTALGIGLKDRKENFVLTLDPSQLKPGVCFICLVSLRILHLSRSSV